MPGGEALRIGPFVGGLNLASDATTVGDAELVVLKNMELDIDGSLRSRPPIKQVATPDFGGAGGDLRALIIGNAIFAGVGYLFASNAEGVWQSTNGTSWTNIRLDTECKTCVQYRGKVWFPATTASATAGFSWDPIGGATTISTMPRGESCVVHKERLYICPGFGATTNASRLHFSDAADLATWTGSNFIDVSPDDGSTLNHVIVYADNLMLFKNESVFVLAYDLQPAEAILREINPTLGVQFPHCVVQFENAAYMLHRDTVYEIVNYDFNPLNEKVPFVLDTSIDSGVGARTETVSLSLLGERLIVRYYNKTYVFGLRTRTWSEWIKTDGTSTVSWHNLGPLIRLPHATDKAYYASYAYAAAERVFKMNDGWNAADSEGTVGTHTITCSIQTKDFDMADPMHFKKLFWWGADVTTGNNVIGTVQAVVVQASTTTWSQMTGNWSTQTQVWSLGVGAPSPVITTSIGDGAYSISKSIKFKKAIRFRKARFSLEMVTKGLSTDGPAKIFSIVVVVGTKQTVSKEIN